MSLVLESENKIDDDVLITPLFSLYDCNIIIKHKEGEKIFNLNEITNVRFQKKRNFSINIFFLFFTILFYSFTSDYFHRNFIFHILLYVITIASSLVSLSVEHYTYMLYINFNHLDYRKLSLSKKDVYSAMHLVSLFKRGYLKKK
jgi:hypothetical protein